MSNSNERIKSFIKYYIEKEPNPDYAVLITGCWGAGKTYFVKKCLAGNVPEGKDIFDKFDWLTECEKYTIIYVSLYGITDRKDIEYKIQNTLFPYLSSKDIDYLPDAMSLIQNLSDITTKIDVDSSDNGKIDDSLVFFTADFIEGIKKGQKKLAIVFDDLERSDVSPLELLGCLNGYVERLHVPCILIADKDKWEEPQEDSKYQKTSHSLQKTKEKIVGKEFLIQTSFDEVWTKWNESGYLQKQAKVWEVIKNFSNDICNIMHVTGINNYRALKHCLSDFGLFIEGIEEEFLSNEEFNKLLVCDFFSHQYSYYLGAFAASDIGQSNSWERAFAKVNHKRMNLTDEELEEKYPLLPYERFEKDFADVKRLSNTYTIDNYAQKWTQIWEEWFSKNYVDPERLNDLIRNSMWFDLRDDYYLNKMYDWFMLDDESGQKAMNAFENALKSKKITSPTSIMCLCDRLYWLAQRNVFVEDYAAFCQKMENYVDSVKENLEYENVDEWVRHTFQGAANNEVKSELDRLQERLKSLLVQKASSYKQNKMDEFFENLMNENEAVSENTCDTIIHDYLEGQNFEFGSLDATRFCEVYRKIPSRVKTKCFRALESRYKYHPEQLEKERNFLQNVLKTAQNIYDNAKRPLTPSIFAFYYLIRTIKEILGEKENVA